jgi:peptide/nickel transport system substrate-binding protein
MIGARTSGGSNYGNYESPIFDTAVDSALGASSPARSRAHWLRAYQTIVDDAPAVWLFEPRLVAGAHRRLRLTGLRADAWWAELDRWGIPLAERIGRDRVGVR